MNANAQDAVAPQVLDPVVVTATRTAVRDFDVPASVDTIDRATIQSGQPMVNLSEILARIPGMTALNRQNYAQDLQISSRGFGARSTFGVRGIRLFQDDIPATMPDGQGQTGSFSLLSAQRIEVLRGPFSTLYGNASGGVISVYTEDGTPRPEVTATFGAGSYGARTLGLKLTGSSQLAGETSNPLVRYVAAAGRFDTDGYREHSAAQRTVTNAKLAIATSPDTKLTVIGSTQYQFDTQDPLGLSRAQWETNPRSVDPSALQYDTRKTIGQEQGGVSLDQRISGATDLKLTGYYGQRRVRQYLALRGDGATSSGGVTDLDRSFDGASARITWRGGRDLPVRLTAGIDFDRQDEHRRGYVNDSGNLGDLRRDEDDRVQSTAVYGQVEWSPWASLSLTGGLRSAEVSFRSADHYVNALNPDDSGGTRFSNVAPVIGAVYHVADTTNVYASYGTGFETPTFAELAYRRGGTGLNFGLDAATSHATEIGFKTLIAGRHRFNLAIFTTSTDNEIVVDTATGGRTIYKNAGRTERRGVEVIWDGQLTRELTGHVALTWLRATFADAFTTGTPPATIGAGARLPGVPPRSAYAELAWTPAGMAGFNAAVEVQHTGTLYVNERNTDAAPAVTIGSVRMGFEQAWPAITLREFVRVNNVTDRTYAGSVIVNDTNGRYFEPAPGRNWFAGISARASF